MTNEAKVVLSGEDKLSAIFAKAGTSAKALGFSLDGIKTGAIAALGALAVPVSIGALASIAKASINAVDALNDVADATGASIENISGDYLEGLNKQYEEFYAGWHYPKVVFEEDIFEHRDDILQLVNGAL